MNYWTELDLDYVDQIAARAEYTVLFFGPPRINMLSPIEKAVFSVKSSVNDTLGSLLNVLRRFSPQLEVIGAAQSISFSSVRPRTPVPEIGYERPVIVSSPNVSVQAIISRLVIPYDNLMKKATRASWLLARFDLGGMDFNHHRIETLYPFGLGIVMSNELNASPVAKLYLEGCKIVGVSGQITAGQSIVVETIQVVGHRIVRLDSLNLEDYQEK